MQPGFEFVTLRPASSDDLDFLLQVYASTRMDELEGLGWDDDQTQAFVRLQFDAQRRCYPERDNRIILLRGFPVGRLLVDITDDAILLVDIALLNEYRNRGIGTGLIRNLQLEARAAGKPLRLHVLAMSPAVRLYDRLGFRKVGGDQVRLEMTWPPADS